MGQANTASSSEGHKQDAPAASNTSRSVEESLLRMQIGQVVSVNGARVLIMVGVSKDKDNSYVPRLGSMVCIETGAADIVASVAGLSSPAPGLNSEESEMLVAELELIGEFKLDENGQKEFRRGISTFPGLGDFATSLTLIDNGLIYGARDPYSVTIGQVGGIKGVPAKLRPRDLLNGNLAIFGSDGAGKSCAVALMIRAIVKSKNPARIILVDQHNEYTRSFGRAANIMPMNAGVISHWMLSFRELVYLLEVHGGALEEDEKDLLSEAISSAKKRYLQHDQVGTPAGGAADSIRTMIDLPIPYRISDLITFFERTAATRIQHNQDTVRHLRARIESVSRMREYRSVFNNISATDTLSAFLSQVFRVPLNKQPITVLQMGGLPPVLCEIFVSVIARLTLALSEVQKGSLKFLLMLEEAHYYLPADPTHAPVSTSALMSILERGAKKEVSIGIVSSRLRFINEDALEHLSTMLAMRLPSVTDQERLIGITPETASGLLSKVGVIDQRECVAVGAGVPVPVRFSLAELPTDAVPIEPGELREKQTATNPHLSELDSGFVQSVVDRWRFADD